MEIFLPPTIFCLPYMIYSATIIMLLLYRLLQIQALKKFGVKCISYMHHVNFVVTYATIGPNLLPTPYSCF